MPKPSKAKKGKKGSGKAKRTGNKKKEAGAEKKDTWQAGLRKSSLFSSKLLEHQKMFNFRSAASGSDEEGKEEKQEN